MRLKLLRRSLTVSSPRLQVRSAWPWPLKWLFIAIFLGFCSAAFVWAFEFGKSFAKLTEPTKSSAETTHQLEEQIKKLRQDYAEKNALMIEAISQAKSEAATNQTLMEKIRLLENDSTELRNELEFFKHLIPSNKSEKISIRRVSAERTMPNRLDWRVLLTQSVKNAAEVRGLLEVTAIGSFNGQPWSQALENGPIPFGLRQYQRLEGVILVPPGAKLQQIQVRLLDTDNRELERARMVQKIDL